MQKISLIKNVRFLITSVLTYVVVTTVFSSFVIAQEQTTRLHLDSLYVESFDGTKLATMVMRPEGEGTYPTIICRTPYGSAWSRKTMENYAKRGYAYLVQDTRGRFNSEGVFDPFIHGVKDGDATLEWVRSQPWSNGDVGSMGHSYVGFTALYLAAGSETPPKSVVVNQPVASPEGGLFYGGAMNHHFDYYWSLLVDGKDQDLEYMYSLDWEHLFGLLPLTTAHRGVNKEIISYRKWIEWANGSFGRGELPEIADIPTGTTAYLLIGGWFDLFNNDIIKLYHHLSKSGTKERIKLIIGPYDHAMSPPPDCDMNFGDWNTVEVSSIMSQWPDRWLLGSENGVEDLPSVQFFLLGENRWVGSETWPPAGMREVKYYLQSDGSANTLNGSGRLTTRAPEKESFDTYVYDPANPAPTKGGILCCLRPMTHAGPMDQREIETRDDVLVYTTGVLEQDITVAGPVMLELFASSGARDTDFTGKLVDVFPDGTALNITDGILRARFRNGYGKPEFLNPNTIERYRIDLGSTAVTFQKGHRIRLEVSSSNFPRFDRNLNTGGPVGKEETMKKATQKVFHDSINQSYLLLPVVRTEIF